MPSEGNSPTIRAGAYARYSSDLQSPASIDDQLRVCTERAAKEGWQVIESYTDQGISGATLIRPGIRQLLQDAAAGKVDIILTESLDRVSRDQEDIADKTKRGLRGWIEAGKCDVQCVARYPTLEGPGDAPIVDLGALH